MLLPMVPLWFHNGSRLVVVRGTPTFGPGWPWARVAWLSFGPGPVSALAPLLGLTWPAIANGCGNFPPHLV
jgi:hypothetical protein